MNPKYILIALAAVAGLVPHLRGAEPRTNTVVLRGIELVDHARDKYGMSEPWVSKPISEIIPTNKISKVYVTAPMSLTTKQSAAVAQEDMRLTWTILRSKTLFVAKEKIKSPFSPSWQALVIMTDGTWYILEADRRSIERDIVVKVRSELRRGSLVLPNPRRKKDS